MSSIAAQTVGTTHSGSSIYNGPWVNIDSSSSKDGRGSVYPVFLVVRRSSGNGRSVGTVKLEVQQFVEGLDRVYGEWQPLKISTIPAPDQGSDLKDTLDINHNAENNSAVQGYLHCYNTTKLRARVTVSPNSNSINVGWSFSIEN